MVELETYIGIALGIVAIAGIGYNVARSQFKTEKELSEQRVKVDVLWKIFEEQLPKLLIHPHTPERDALMKKYHDKTATKEELLRLRDMIDEEIKSGENTLECFGLSMMKPVLEHNIEHFR